MTSALSSENQVTSLPVFCVP